MGRGARISVSVGIGFLVMVLIGGVTGVRAEGTGAVAALLLWLIAGLCAYALIKPAPR